MCVGGDLQPSTLLSAYVGGYFPMMVRRGTIGWWSPDPRGVIPLDGLKVSRSLRRSLRRYVVRFDHDTDAVIEACATIPRPHGWITPDLIAAYTRLAHLGWVHSVETWSVDGQLVGGLYGVRIGGFFAGESMFSVATDASKVALVHLVDWLRDTSASLLDVQWTTPHLRSLGAIDVPRRDYLVELDRAVSGEGSTASATTE